jgi:hypothetical protein
MADSDIIVSWHLVIPFISMVYTNGFTFVETLTVRIKRDQGFLASSNPSLLEGLLMAL